MERARFNGRQLALALGWSETKLSRLLSGQINVPERDLSAFLALCRIIGEERDRLLCMSRETTPGWLQQFAPSVPEQVKTLVDHELRATEIVQFEPIRIPGLLQSADYAEALIERVANVPSDEVQPRVAARMARKNIYREYQHPRFTFYIHEFALRLPVGGAEVMSDQLHDLLRFSVRKYITIRIVPAAFGAHPGSAGACRLMEFQDFKPMVYIEGETAGLFLEEDDEIAAYRRLFSALAKCALDEQASRDMIAALAVELYGEDLHELEEE